MVPLLAMLAYPEINPIALDLGWFTIRWYGLAYLGGVGLGTALVWRRLRSLGWGPAGILDWVGALMMGMLLGGRLGYVIIYDAGRTVSDPLSALAIWQGGMSFHGGLIGVLVAGYWMTRKKEGPTRWQLADTVVLGVCPGLCLGRLANFINQELVGRVTHVPWGMPVPGHGPWPRHPSPLYEAMGEGVVLGTVLWLIATRLKPREGVLMGVFLTGYGLIRFGLEWFREPDPQIGLLAGLSMGQWCCVAMVVAGAWVMFCRWGKPASKNQTPVKWGPAGDK